MQTETTIIIVGLIVGWIATAIFLHKAAKKAYARGVDIGFNRQADSRHLAQHCTIADHELLTNIGTTLRIANETWQAFPGTDLMQAKATQQRRQLAAFAAKMWVAAYPPQPIVEDEA